MYILAPIKGKERKGACSIYFYSDESSRLVYRRYVLINARTVLGQSDFHVVVGLKPSLNSALVPK